MSFARAGASKASSLLSATRPAASSLRSAPLSRQNGAARTLSASANRQGKVLLVLYDVSSTLFPSSSG